MNKILILLFVPLYLLGLDYYFSLENNSINIQRNQNIDIVFNAHALKSVDENLTDDNVTTSTGPIDGDFIDDKWVQESVSIKETNASGKKMNFDASVEHELYTTFSLYPKNLKSNFRYFVEINGSKFKDRIGEFPIDKNISFRTANFVDIVYPKEVNISLSSSIDISIVLNKSPSQDVEIAFSTNDRNISVYPSKITLSSINYMNGSTNIRTNNKLLKDGNYSITIKNNSLGIEQEIKLKVVNSKVSLLTNIESAFSPQMSKNLSVSLNRPGINNYEVLVSNTKSGITLSKKKLIFTRDNFNISQNIIINAKAITTDTNDTISLTSRDMNKSFDIRIIIPKKEGDTNATPVIVNPITILKTTSLFTKINWKAEASYKGDFSILIGFSKENINLLVGEANETSYNLMHQPNSEYFIAVKYKDNSKLLGSIKVKALKVNLDDSDKDGLSNDLEEFFDTATYPTDSNQDNIADVIQNYLLQVDNKVGKNLADYTLSSDMDGDKIGDILELNLGRDPKTNSFNGQSALEITVPSDGASIYVSNFSGLQTASNIRVNHTASINGYIGEDCLQNGILVANFLTKDTCKNIKQEPFTSGTKTIIWVAIDDFGNIAYKKQILSIFKKLDSNSSSGNMILFTVSDINYTIKTKTGSSLSFGALATSKSYTNPIVYEKDTLISEFSFTNNIFDIIIQSYGGVASVAIKQPITIQKNSYFRIFKNNAYSIFNTSGGDKVYSTKGNNNECSLSESYTESLNERDYCIKLEIKDGGLNDSDGLLNGSVSLIGGASVTPKIVSINDDSSIGCSSLHAGGFNDKKATFDYLIVFSFLISLIYTIKMFAKKRY